MLCLAKAFEPCLPGWVVRARNVLRHARVEAGLAQRSHDAGEERPLLIFPPNSSFCGYYDLLCLLLLVVEGIIVPFGVAFGFPEDFPPSEEYGLVSFAFYSNFTTLAFVVDIVKNFRKAFYYHGTIIVNPAAIAYNYLQKSFWVDVIAAFPFHASGLRMVRVLKTLPTCMRVLAAFPSLSTERKGSMTLVVDSTQIVFVLAFFSHLAACLFQLMPENTHSAHFETRPYSECDLGGPCQHGVVGSKWLTRYGLDQYELNLSMSHRYILALELGSSLLVGGDASIDPGTESERVFCVFFSLLALVLNVYLTARFVEAINKVMEGAKETTMRLSAIADFEKQCRLPSALTARVRFCLRSRFKDMLEVRKEPLRAELIEELPQHLRQEVLYTAYADLLRRFPFFGRMTDLCIAQLASLVTKRVYVRGQLVRRMRKKWAFEALPNIPVFMSTGSRGIRYILRGALHSVAEYELHYCGSAYFDADCLFADEESVVPQVISARNDPKSGLASPNPIANLSGLVLGCIKADQSK